MGNFLEKLQLKVNEVTEDYKKGVAGNKAAGTRVRVAMQEVKELAKAIRTEMSEAKKQDLKKNHNPLSSTPLRQRVVVY
jgi:hypothetical protein